MGLLFFCCLSSFDTHVDLVTFCRFGKSDTERCWDVEEWRFAVIIDALASDSSQVEHVPH